MTDYPPPPMPGKASAWRRFAARLVDALVLLIPVLIVTLMIGDGFNIGTNNTGGERFAATLAGLLLTFAYFVVMEVENGGTLGKRALRMTVSGGDGQRLTYGQAAKRNAFILLSAVPGTIGGVLSFGIAIALGIHITVDDEGRAFHDHWAGAVVRSDP